MNETKQMSESLVVGTLLALVGGFLDAYTYIARAKVFANAQTGNIVLLGINLAEGNLSKATAYLVPIGAFFIGIIIAEVIRSRYQETQGIHWRQIIIGIECLVLMLVAFMPQTLDMLANMMVSFVCALQVESFRKMNGVPYATTMCTGNLRSATEHLYYYRKQHDKKRLYKSLQYFWIIAVFVIGACLGSLLCKVFLLKSVLFTLPPLMIVVLLMFQVKHKAINDENV